MPLRLQNIMNGAGVLPLLDEVEQLKYRDLSMPSRLIIAVAKSCGKYFSLRDINKFKIIC